MATFDSDTMGLRYIYLDVCDNDTNPTRPVLSRLVVRIFAGDEKTEIGQNDIYDFFRRSGDRRQLLVIGRGVRQLDGASPVGLVAGRWLERRWRLPAVLRL
ncbi:hypothetical protein TorRG33x02_268960 [Trema orientale]|uniref:Uncharacterized protein n=1 Tax=Trema orientale TaxID=63057 RepID=A0A2P5CYI0_TREOI|nr:hypothetical protein TorRG33x02_268960 [Trema orientale]